MYFLQSFAIKNFIIKLVFILMSFFHMNTFLWVKAMKNLSMSTSCWIVQRFPGDSATVYLFFYGQLWTFVLLTLSVLACSRNLLWVTFWKIPLARCYWAWFKQLSSTSRSYMVLRRQSIFPVTSYYRGQIPSNNWSILFKVNFR